jgi:hypothetical protein
MGLHPLHGQVRPHQCRVGLAPQLDDPEASGVFEQQL